MNEVTHTYLLLLKSAIWNQALPALVTADWTDNDWYELEQLALRQGTAALVYDRLLSLEQSIPADMQSRMRGLCAMQMMRMPSQAALLDKVLKTLKEGDVRPVLLKGFGLAALYPRPELRSWGDVDVFVGKDQYHQGAGLLRAAFPESVHHEVEWEALKHYNLIVKGGVIEMHRVSIKLDHPRDLRIYDRLEAEGTRPDRVERIALPETHTEADIPWGPYNMLYTFMHAWTHFVDEGLGMKQVSDVSLLARREYIQVCDNPSRQKGYHDYLLRAVNGLCLDEAWQLIGYVAVTCLDLPAEMWQGYWLGGEGNVCQRRWLRKHGPKFVERIMAEGMLRETHYGEGENRYTEREKNLRMPMLLRKLKTLYLTFGHARMIRPYSSRYARHIVATALWKGWRRLWHKEETVLY